MLTRLSGLIIFDVRKLALGLYHAAALLNTLEHVFEYIKCLRLLMFEQSLHRSLLVLLLPHIEARTMVLATNR